MWGITKRALRKSTYLLYLPIYISHSSHNLLLKDSSQNSLSLRLSSVAVHLKLTSEQCRNIIGISVISDGQILIFCQIGFKYPTSIIQSDLYLCLIWFLLKLKWNSELKHARLIWRLCVYLENRKKMTSWTKVMIVIITLQWLRRQIQLTSLTYLLTQGKC